MKKLAIAIIAMGCMMLFQPGTVYAGGGAAGASPGANFQGVFKNGSDIWIRVQFRAEAHLGDEEDNHAVGGAFSYDIGTGFTPGFVGLTPYYHYHFKDAKESGAYVGGQFDVKLKSGFNVIGLQAVGGYQHFFNDRVGLYGEAEVGFASIGGSFSGRSTGADFGVNVGVKVNFGNN